MKKLLSILALALCFVACQNEGVENPTNGDLVNVVLSVDAPELGVTRADEDNFAGKNSAFGAIDFMNDADWDNYDLRYILEVYDANDEGTGEPIYRERLVNCLDKYAPTQFDLRLVPNRDYKFVVFADFVAEGSAEAKDMLAIADLYYNTADLRNISAITAEPTWNAMNEVRDAYFVSENLSVEASLTKTLTLTRPFAKLRVIATDLDYIAGYSAPGYVEVTYHTEALYKSFNAVNGQLNETQLAGDELKYAFNVNKNIPYAEGYDAEANCQTLFTDYLFAHEGQQIPVNFKMAVYESEGGRLIKETDFNTQIPIQRNHLTTMIGDILTTEANITVEVNDKFVDEWVNPTMLTTPEVTAAVEKNTVTLKWEAVEGATKYFTRIVAEGNTFEETTELTKYYADLEWETEYTFEVYAMENNGIASKYATVTATTEKEPVALATPAVVASVDVNVVTLTWDEVEGAAYYTVQVDDDVEEKVEATTYEFEGDYEVEYMFTVKAYAADYKLNYDSEAAVVKVTTEAEPVAEAQVVTVAEFLAATEGTTMYQLTGVITSVANTTYGNFYLKDATGEVLIWGLCSPEGKEKYWAESGAKVGDTITVQTVRSSYNGAPQGKNALFVELKPFVAEASEWGIVGDLNSWGNDVTMYTTWHTENLFVAYNVEITSGAFKIRANKTWNDAKNYGLEVAGSIYANKYYSVYSSGGSQNITPMEYGTYDVYFDLNNKRVALMAPGKAYAEATDGGKPVVVVAGLKDHEWGLVGSFNDWNVANYVTTVVEGDWAVAKNVTLENGAEFKFAADKAWTLSYGSACDVIVGTTYTTYNNAGNMKFVGEAGAYDVYFSLIDASFYMEKHADKAEYTKTLTFDDKAKRTEYSTSIQVWEENGIKVTNDKASSTTNVGDYANPGRFYKGSNVKIEAPGAIVSISINVSGLDSKYVTPWGTASNGIVTITLDGTSNTYQFTNLSAQARANSITVTYVK